MSALRIRGMTVNLTVNNSILLCIDYQERVLRNMCDKEVILRNAVIMIKAAKILGVPIIVTEQYRKGLGDTVPAVGEALQEYTSIDKVYFSCFKSEEFVSQLKRLKRKNLIAMGIESHVCVYQTVLDAVRNGYCAYVLEDAVSSRTELNRRIAIEKMRQEGIFPVSVEMVIFELLQKAGTPQFKELLKIVK